MLHRCGCGKVIPVGVPRCPPCEAVYQARHRDYNATRRTMRFTSPKRGVRCGRKPSQVLISLTFTHSTSCTRYAAQTLCTTLRSWARRGENGSHSPIFYRFRISTPVVVLFLAF
ncbi:MAG: hypothetical protein LBJ12_06660 [Oscillospiraceae bacterium]|nr:hypothetical protein [Oscillospiraceae bacterium]